MAWPARRPLLLPTFRRLRTAKIHFEDYRIEDTLTEPIKHQKISTDVK